jgi:hypothetical protein
MATRTIIYENCQIYLNYAIFSMRDLEIIQIAINYFQVNFIHIYPKYHNLKYIDQYLQKQNLYV